MGRRTKSSQRAKLKDCRKYAETLINDKDIDVSQRPGEVLDNPCSMLQGMYERSQKPNDYDKCRPAWGKKIISDVIVNTVRDNKRIMMSAR